MLSYVKVSQYSLKIRSILLNIKVRGKSIEILLIKIQTTIEKILDLSRLHFSHFPNIQQIIHPFAFLLKSQIHFLFIKPSPQYCTCFDLWTIRKYEFAVQKYRLPKILLWYDTGCNQIFRGEAVRVCFEVLSCGRSHVQEYLRQHWEISSNSTEPLIYWGKKRTRIIEKLKICLVSLYKSNVKRWPS